MRALHASFLVVAVGGLVATVGCAASNQTAADQTQPQMSASQARVTSADIAPRSEEATSLSVPPGIETTPPKATAGTPLAVAAPTGVDPGKSMTDAQIAAVAEAIIDGELNEARVAAKRTKSAHVKALADRIAADEGSAGAELTAFEARHPMAPEHTKSSDDLKTQNASSLTTLRAAHGPSFDDSYIDGEIASCARLTALLDTLTPEADAPELRGQLEKLRTAIATHGKLAADAKAARAEHRANE